MDYDVIIIGGGPAGLSAGLYSARAKKKTLVLEGNVLGGQVMDTSSIENLPGSSEDTSAMTLVDRLKDQAEEFGAEISMEEVVHVDLECEWKMVYTSEHEYRARAVIIATGSNPRKLGIPGEQAYTGMGISYCATCDGAFYFDLPVYIVGGGDSAFDEGLYLSNFVESVTILYRGPVPRAAKSLQERVAKKDNMKLVLNTEVIEIKGDEMGMNGFVAKNGETGEITEIEGRNFGLFIFIGNEPNTQLFEDQLTLSEKNYIPATENTKTAIPGVFAAGDVRQKPLRQVVTSTADGAVAAVAAGKYIDENFQ